MLNHAAFSAHHYNAVAKLMEGSVQSTDLPFDVYVELAVSFGLLLLGFTIGDACALTPLESSGDEVKRSYQSLDVPEYRTFSRHANIVDKLRRE